MMYPVQAERRFPSFLHVVVLSLVFLATLALGSFGTARGTASAATGCGAWNVVSSPNAKTTTNVFFGVSALSAQSVWAVGNSGSDVLIEHWNGKSWKISVGPTTKSIIAGTLSSVSAFTAKDVWAVGNTPTSTPGVTQTLIVHWNGKQWSVISSPGAGSQLNSVVALSAQNVWAVGSSSTVHGSQALIEHWNGTAWSVISSPSAGSQLNSVSVVGANDIWTVGSLVNTHGPQTLIEHWNGTTWSIVVGNSPGTAGNNLTGVSAIATNNVWAVGNDTNSTGPHATYTTLVEHWNGTKWSIVASPVVGTSDLIGGIAATSASDLWLVGRYTTDPDPASGTYLTLIEHWNGTAWSVVASPNPNPNDNILTAVTHVPNSTSAWAVGFVTDTSTYQTLTETYC